MVSYVYQMYTDTLIVLRVYTFLGVRAIED
jgi:hypothetical protein